MSLIFVPAVGQYDNIGDIVLRRPLLDMLRPYGQLHVFVGKSPPGYEEALRLAPGDIAYRSFSAWYRALLRSAGRRTVHYVFKPGEIQLTLRGMKEHVGMIPALVAVHRSGGKVLRIGAGARNLSPLPRLAMKPSLTMTDLAVWRDQETADYLGGGTMPDLGFSTAGGPDMDRELLVVSMRGDRPLPDSPWLKGIQAVATSHHLEIHVATQVARDDERTRELAAKLNGHATTWDGTAHSEQEAALRNLYSRAAIVASDRLHVLITAVTEGAAPVAPLHYDSAKIARHFAAAGYEAPTVHTRGLNADQIRDRVNELVGAHSKGALAHARESISRVAVAVSAMIGEVEDRNA